jgi:YbbR domain-containing protein
MPIEARNLPARHALTEEVPKNAKVRLRGAGRSLFKTIILKNFISDFKLVLDLERISEEYDFILNDYFERYPQKIVIPSSFEVDYVEVVYPNAIHISLDEYKEKTVNVISNIYFDPSPGYTLVGKPIIEPEKIKIAGSKNIVELINFVKTEADTFNNLTNDFSISIPLNSIRDQLIEYTPKTVLINQEIQSISERIISEIPVQIINENDALQVFVSPQTVSLTVIGGTDYIASLKPNDIYISVDFNNWKSQKQFYELQVNIPKDVMKWMDLSPRNIELIVTRK